jgi:hypothetical protein
MEMCSERDAIELGYDSFMICLTALSVAQTMSRRTAR